MQKNIYLILVIILTGSVGVPSVSAREWYHREESVEIHGFLSQGFLKSDRNNFYAETEEGTFQFNEFGINFAADPTDRLRLGVQFLSRDLGEIGNNAVEIDWAYADYRWKDWLSLRAGQIKAVWGLYNETRDVDMLRTSIFLPMSLYAEDERNVYANLQGIALYGDLPMNEFGSLNYQVQYGEKTVETDSGIARAIVGNESIEIRNFQIKDLLVGNIEWNTPVEGLHFGMTHVRFRREITLSAAPEDSTQTATETSSGTLYKNDAESTVISAEYTRDAFTLAAEYMRGSSRLPTRDHTQEGYYGNVSYRLTDWWEVGAYYSVFYPDMHDKDGEGKRDATDAEEAAPAEETQSAQNDSSHQERPTYHAWQKELVLTTRFDLNDHWTVKLEGHVVDGSARLFDKDNPDNVQGTSFLFAIKTTFNF